MTANEPHVLLQAILLLAPPASVVIALIAFLFLVWNGWRNKREEGSRRDWERLQQLAQIMHNGTDTGVWAQKLAVRELSQLTSKRREALLLAREALDYWQRSGNTGSLVLEEELREVIRKLSTSKAVWSARSSSP